MSLEHRRYFYLRAELGQTDRDKKYLDSCDVNAGFEAILEDLKFVLLKKRCSRLWSGWTYFGHKTLLQLLSNLCPIPVQVQCTHFVQVLNRSCPNLPNLFLDIQILIWPKKVTNLWLLLKMEKVRTNLGHGQTLDKLWMWYRWYKVNPDFFYVLLDISVKCGLILAHNTSFWSSKYPPKSTFDTYQPWMRPSKARSLNVRSHKIWNAWKSFSSIARPNLDQF